MGTSDDMLRELTTKCAALGLAAAPHARVSLPPGLTTASAVVTHLLTVFESGEDNETLTGWFTVAPQSQITSACAALAAAACERGRSGDMDSASRATECVVALLDAVDTRDQVLAPSERTFPGQPDASVTDQQLRTRLAAAIRRGDVSPADVLWSHGRRVDPAVPVDLATTRSAASVMDAIAALTDDTDLADRLTTEACILRGALHPQKLDKESTA